MHTRIYIYRERERYRIYCKPAKPHAGVIEFDQYLIGQNNKILNMRA